MNLSQTDNQNSAFDLSDLLIFLWQKKIRIICSALILLLVGGYYIVNLPKFYTASATLLLGSNDNGFKLPSNMSSFTGGDNSKINTYMEFMRSKQFVQNVVLDLDLQTSKEFQSAIRFGSDLGQLQYSIRFFLQNLSLMPVADTELLRVSFTSASPLQAKQVVNYIGPAFFTFYAEKGKKKADDTSEWLNEQLKLLEIKLAEADTSLQEFMRENRLMDISSQLQLARNEISALLAEKLMNEKALARIESTYQQIKKFNNDYSILMKNSYFLQNQLVISMRGKVVAQQQIIAELSKRYKSKHHRYIAAKITLDGLNNELVELLNNLISNLEQEYNSLKVRQNTLNEQIEIIKSEHSDLGKHELQLERLRREVISTQKLHEVFLTRLQETEILKDLGNTEDFIVVDLAETPRAPSKPKVKILLAVFAIFCGFVSVVFWLLLHFISDKQTRFRQLLRKLDVPLLAEVPKIKTSKSTQNIAKTLGEGEQDYVFSEAVRSLRTAILMRTDERGERTIALTGIQDGDGKTTISVSLALAFAKLEKVILVDSDLRMPSVAQVFGLAKEHPGLSNFISRRAQFRECLFRQPDTRLSVLTSGAVPSDPMIYISKPRFAQLIKKLGEVYERVVLDTPSVNTVSDALVISKHVDSVILVCDIDKLESDSLIEAIQRLRENGAPLLGVVFNKVKRTRHKRRKNMVKQTQVINKS